MKTSNTNSNLKYTAVVFQDIGTDVCTITHATQESIEQDGCNWVGRNDFFELKCYATLKEAINEVGYWPASIKFGSDFTEEELNQVVEIVNALIHDPEYCHGYLREVATKDFTKKDLIFIKEDKK